MAFPLHDAAKTGNVKAVNELLAQQVDVNQKDRLNRTPLHMAAWAGQTVRRLGAGPTQHPTQLHCPEVSLLPSRGLPNYSSPVSHAIRTC